MSNLRDRSTFEAAYAGKAPPPWRLERQTSTVSR